MNKFLLISLLALIAFSFQSCNEDVQLATEYKEVPVIYGLLDQSDSLHFIKINRAFIGPGNAFDIAQIADSNYFTNVNAKIEEVINNTVVRSWTLRDTTLYTKSTNGLFYAPENKVYYFDTKTNPLLENATYRLTVDINEGKLIVQGETRLVSGFATQIGANTSVLSNNNLTLKFAKDPGELISTSIWCQAGTAAFGNVSLDIEISEYRGTDSTHIHVPWVVSESTVANNKITGVALGQTFYDLVKSKLTNDNTIDKRNFEGFRVTYTGGADELYKYILVNKPTSSLTQSKPTFTNLTVTEGYSVVGLFSARNVFSIYIPFINPDSQYIRCIDANTMRELCQGAITGNAYYFCSQHPIDNSSSNPKPYACN
ncbi:MAG: hypothetical protein WC044_11805 [Crocinitomicaceae bacterium]